MHGVYNRAQVEFSYEKEIGQDGKNSQAFIAHDSYLDARLVIKKIPIKSFEDEEGFFKESRLLYKASHANVVQIQYACKCDEYIYLALPYYKNGSLKDLMRQRNLTMREVVRFSIQACAGLHNIHSKGLVHFDIKPDNILLSDRMEALISDFGLAKALSSEKTAEPDQMYNKHIAPEYFSEEGLTVQYDIYQLGLTVYRLIVGDIEFHGQIAKFSSMEEFKNAILKGSFPDKLSLEHIPSRLKKVVEKCLEVNLSKRFSSPLAVANELSLIDCNTLDWQYETEGNIRKWHKITPTHEYLLTVTDDLAEAKKKTVQGKWARMKDSCRVLTSAEIRQFLRRH